MPIQRAWPALVICAATLLFGLYCFPDFGRMWENVIRGREAPLGYDFHAIYRPLVDLNLYGENVYAIGYKESLPQREAYYFKEPLVTPSAPPYFLLHRPLARYGFFDACLIYVTLAALTYTAAIWCVARSVLPRGLAAALALQLALLLPYTAIGQDALMLAQSSLFVAAAAGLAFVFRNRAPILCGFCNVYSVFNKVWPGLVLVHFCDPRRRRALAWSLGWLCLLGAAAGLLWGFSIYPAWVARIRRDPVYFNQVNQSVVGALLRLTDGQHSGLIVAIAVLAAVMGALAVRYFCHRNPPHPDYPAEASELVEYSIYLMLSTVLAPFSWPHHHLILYIPFLALCALGVARPGTAVAIRAWIGAILIAALYCLDGEVVMVRWVMVLHDLYRGFNGVLLHLLSILCLLVFVLLRLRDPGDAGEEPTG